MSRRRQTNEGFYSDEDQPNLWSPPREPEAPPRPLPSLSPIPPEDTIPSRQSKEGDATRMVAQRHSLPTTHESVTHKFQIMGHEGYLTIGLFDNGQPGEIFIKMAKEGSTMSGLVQGFCRAFSLALQYGLSLEEAVGRFKGMRFEPMGHTSNPDIPEAMSIIDYVARYLDLHFGGRDSRF
jgi:ribonucleoside-diphosphate reductase alpha chain